MTKTHFEFEEVIEGFDDYSCFANDPLTAGLEAAGKGLEMGGKIAEASARKKEAEAKIVEIGGKRQAQLKDCENNKAFKKFADRKYRNNRILECQNEVKKRLDTEEQEQKDVVRRMANIEEGKLNSDIDIEKQKIDEAKTSKKTLLIGGLIGLILVLGTIVYLKNKK